MIILHVATRARSGGTKKTIESAIKYEESLGHVVYFASGVRGNRLLDSQNKSAPVNRIPIRSLGRTPNPFWDLLAIVELKKIINRVHPDVIHTHESKAGFVGRIASLYSGLITIHTVHMAVFKSQPRNLIELIYARIEFLLSKWTDFLIFVGEDLLKIYEANRISSRHGSRVIHSRIDLVEFFAVRSMKRDSSGKFSNVGGDVSTKKILITIGLLEKRKRQDLIITKLRPLLLQDDCVLLVCGDGQLRSELETLVSQLGLTSKVHFLGYRTDIPFLLASSDLLVHGSEFEGVSQVIVQSLAVGTPVVSTKAEGYSELPEVTWAAENGEDLTELVRSELQNPRKIDISPLEFTRWSDDFIDIEHSKMLGDVSFLHDASNSS